MNVFEFNRFSLWEALQGGFCPYGPDECKKIEAQLSLQNTTRNPFTWTLRKATLLMSAPFIFFAVPLQRVVPNFGEARSRYREKSNADNIKDRIFKLTFGLLGSMATVLAWTREGPYVADAVGAVTVALSAPNKVKFLEDMTEDFVRDVFDGAIEALCRCVTTFTRPSRPLGQMQQLITSELAALYLSDLKK